MRTQYRGEDGRGGIAGRSGRWGNDVGGKRGKKVCKGN